MSTKTVGFIGTDKYEFVCYIGKMLSERNMKVLLVDYTALRGLMSTVPDYIQGEVTKYQGIFLFRRSEDRRSTAVNSKRRL